MRKIISKGGLYREIGCFCGDCRQEPARINTLSIPRNTV